MEGYFHMVRGGVARGELHSTPTVPPHATIQLEKAFYRGGEAVVVRGETDKATPLQNLEGTIAEEINKGSCYEDVKKNL